MVVVALALERLVEYDGAGSIVISRASGKEEARSEAAEARPSKKKEEQKDGMWAFVLDEVRGDGRPLPRRS